MDDKGLGDFLGPPAPLDVEAFLRGDLQGRERCSYGADSKPIKEYLRNWRMSEEDYRRRREALDAKQHSYFGSCPECGADGAIHPTPDNTDVLVCSAGCKLGWVFGSGHFRARPEDHGLTAEEVERRLSEYRFVEPLLGWKLDLLGDLDVGIRMLQNSEVAECVVCGFAALPEDPRKLWAKDLSRFVLAQGVPILSLNRQAPLCMVCGQEFSHGLQEAVNHMWGLDTPTGIGKLVSAPHADLDDPASF